MNLLINITTPDLYFSGELWIDFLSRFIANTVALFVLIRYIYYPHNGQSKFLFVFFLTGMMIFLISSTLDQVTLNIGVALGLFAIFGIIRFRTPAVGLKEMTYLFITIGMAVINALVEFNVANWFGLLIANVIILGSAFVMEKYKPKTLVLKKPLVFNPTNFENIDSEELLIEDIKKTTGMEVFNIEISKINKSKNEIMAWVYYIPSKRKSNSTIPEAIASNEEPEESNLNAWESTFSNNY
jgi:hypothetical protein